MAKQKIKLKDLKRDQLRKNLKMVHPFLSGKFRTIKSEELKSKEVYKEFFGPEEFKAWKLRAIFEYQK